MRMAGTHDRDHLYPGNTEGLSTDANWKHPYHSTMSVETQKRYEMIGCDSLNPVGLCPGVQRSMHVSRDLAPNQHLLSSDVN